ncbi:hypothetical protein Cgig2_013863 [Carnegiea gigantea]|uniref:Uncharacterized protein n=1 Tax=Carnegiea gigantea TaxID=171969 RepID=A0A9Q1QK01_9CARY|nr:hypothetical protein Cgig2_013863 [Carnegiea gigantea]
MVSIRMTNTLRKILKYQKASGGEKEIIRKKLQLRWPIQSLSITRLAFWPVGALHGLNYLGYKPGDGLRPVVLTYMKLEVMCRFLSSAVSSPNRFLKGLPSFQSVTSSQLDSWRTKRKSYFQCFIFDFFSMTNIKPSLLLKQYHPKSPVSLGALWMVCTRLNARAVQVRPRNSEVTMKKQMLYHDVGITRVGANSYFYRVKAKPETVDKGRPANDNTFCRRLIHCGICLGDHKGISGEQKVLLLKS